MRRAHLPVCAMFLLLASAPAAQLTDVSQTPNAANAGIKKSYVDQIGAGRGDVLTPGSSTFLIRRDPFRAIVRGRQLFQRKFTVGQGLGPRTGDGVGDIEADVSHGAGLSDSCAACHSRPFGSAGVGGNVFTRPESRDAPHLFGLGLQEMLADEITGDLRATRDAAVLQAVTGGAAVTLPLLSKGIEYGVITGLPDGSVDASGVEGVDPDLRVRPFFAEGTTISIREFAVGAFNAEMGLEAPDPDLVASANLNQDVVTPAGMELTGSTDAIEAPPATTIFEDSDGDGIANEVPTSIVDFMEFYLLNYFRPAIAEVTPDVVAGFELFTAIGCADCHKPFLTIEEDRRVADTSTLYDPFQSNVIFNRLYTTAATLYTEVDDGSGFPTIKEPNRDPFVVAGIFTDFKRHDLGPNFHERKFDGTLTTHLMTEPLWGVGSTAPYGHDGRSATLVDVILRHGGEAESTTLAFVQLEEAQQEQILELLGALVLFAPPDTSSNLDPANTNDQDFPFSGAGSIDLSVLFNVQGDKE
ncbi:MAG: di-heme oxidoredictase family protein [Planctomycetota bacterium]